MGIEGNEDANKQLNFKKGGAEQRVKEEGQRRIVAEESRFPMRRQERAWGCLRALGGDVRQWRVEER